jgi:hypothetical protein
MDEATRIDWEWASQFDSECQIIAMREIAPFILQYIGATKFEDLKKAVDFKIKCPIEDVRFALRVRRSQSAGRFRDLTIRSIRECEDGSRIATEIDKVWGNAAFYFYAWVSPLDMLDAYIVVEINDVLRGLFDKAEDISNNDGTWFRAVSAQTIKESGLLVAGHFASRVRDIGVDKIILPTKEEKEALVKRLSAVVEATEKREPFYLKQGVKIIDPGKWIRSLISDLTDRQAKTSLHGRAFIQGGNDLPPPQRVRAAVLDAEVFLAQMECVK